MYQQNLILVKLLDPVIQAMGYEMLGIEHISRGRGSLLRIYIDSEIGIGIDDCSRVSRQVTGVLDVNDPIQGPYDLEISSPGLDRPLFSLEHFRRFIGSEVRLKLFEKVEGRRTIKGNIVSVNEEYVEINEKGIHYRIPVDAIDKARLIA